MSLPNPQGIGTLCETVIEALLRSPSNDQHASESREGFASEVENLHKFYDLIERVRRARSSQTPAEEVHWQALQRLLLRCRGTLSSLNDRLANPRDSSAFELHYNEPWKMSPSLTEDRMLAASETTLRAHVNLYTQTLQMSLQAINLVHQKRNKTSPETLQSHIQALSRAFTDLNMVLTRRFSLIDRESEARIVLDDALFTDVQRCYSSAKAIVHTGSGATSPVNPLTPRAARETLEYEWPTPPCSKHSGLQASPVSKAADVAPFQKETFEYPQSSPSERSSLQLNEHLDVRRPPHRDSCAVEPLSIRPKETSRIEQKELPKILTDEPPQVNSFLDTNGKHQGSPDSEDDPEPDFEDPGFPPAVYAELIATLQQEVQQEMKAERYDRAELAQLKTINYLTNREISLNIPYDKETKIQMNETLATIYVRQKQHDRAKGILNSLLKQEKLDSDRKWRYYYMLAGVYLEQGRIPEAEKFAKRAYAGRESTFGKGHGLILESAAQLVQIYEAKGEKETAQAFRNLYDNSAQRNQAPQITKHIGTKRVKWNPDISVDINALQKNGETPLITAVTCGDDEMLQRVLQAGAGLEIRGPDGMTPLMHAIWHGHVKIAGVLLSRGAEVDAPTAGWTPLHKASDMGDLDMINLLLQYGADIEAKSPKKLILKNSKPPPPQVPTLHPKPPPPPLDPDTSDSDSDTSSTTTSQGWTPLLRACATGAEPTVRRLLTHNADLESRTPSAATPLITASESHHLPIVDILLIRGACVEASDDFGWKPLHRTLVHKGGEAVAQRLLDAEADLNSTDLYKKTPLHHAVEKNDEGMACFLLRAGADIEARDVAGRTPLFTAIECRWENLVYVLLEFGADAAKRDRAGRDALGAAQHAVRRSPEIVKLLGKWKKAAGAAGKGGGRRDSGSLSLSSTVVGSSGVGEGGLGGSGSLRPGSSGGGGGLVESEGEGGEGEEVRWLGMGMGMGMGTGGVWRVIGGGASGTKCSWDADGSFFLVFGESFRIFTLFYFWGWVWWAIAMIHTISRADALFELTSCEWLFNTGGFERCARVLKTG